MSCAFVREKAHARISNVMINRARVFMQFHIFTNTQAKK